MGQRPRTNRTHVTQKIFFERAIPGLLKAPHVRQPFTHTQAPCPEWPHPILGRQPLLPRGLKLLTEVVNVTKSATISIRGSPRAGGVSRTHDPTEEVSRFLLLPSNLGEPHQCVHLWTGVPDGSAYEPSGKKISAKPNYLKGVPNSFFNFKNSLVEGLVRINFMDRSFLKL